MGTYHVFISCDSFSVNEAELDQFLNKLIQQDGRNTKVKCIPKIETLSDFIHRFNRVEKSSIYVINANEKLDNISYWELGYAMGKGLDVIGFSENIDEINSCLDFKHIINVYDDLEEFVEAIEDLFANLTPKENIFVDDWDTQQKAAEIERGRTNEI